MTPFVFWDACDFDDIACKNGGIPIGYEGNCSCSCLEGFGGTYCDPITTEAPGIKNYFVFFPVFLKHKTILLNVSLKKKLP